MSKFPASLILLLAISLSSISQSDPRIIQFSGIVITGDSLEPVPFVSVFRERDMRGTYTDFNGFFTLPAITGDTIRFTCVGLKPESHVIPVDIKENSITILQVMRGDTIQLKPVYITPWNTAWELKREILAMDVSEAYVQRERFNELREQDGLVEMGPDGSENFKRVMSNYEQRQGIYNTGYVQNNLLNPFAWARFIKALSDGELNPE